jgi:hypothetical protein
MSMLWFVPIGLTIGLATSLARNQSWSWFPQGQTPPQPGNPLPTIQQEAERLCREPGLIAGTLTHRNAQFTKLCAADTYRQELLALADEDPLGALIAWSQPPFTPLKVVGTLEYNIPPAIREKILPMPGGCAALDQVLADQWRAHAQPAASSAVPTSGPPTRLVPTKQCVPPS